MKKTSDALYIVSGVIVLVFGLAKLLSAVGISDGAEKPYIEPLTNMRLDLFFVATGGFEVLLSILLIHRAGSIKAAFSLSILVTGILIYRTLARALNLGLCPCLGSLAKVYPALMPHQKHITSIALGVFIATLVCDVARRSLKPNADKCMI